MAAQDVASKLWGNEDAIVMADNPFEIFRRNVALIKIKREFQSDHYLG